MSIEPKKSGKFSPRRLKTFDSFKIPTYRIYIISMVGFWIATGMQMIAQTLQIYRLTSSATLAGALILAFYIPILLVSLLGGTVADRIQKKYILFACVLGSAISALIIGFALTSGYLSSENPGSWWLLIFSAFLSGIFNGLIQPTIMAIVPELVGQQKVMNGISLSNMGMTFCRIIGPMLAGFLIDSFGFSIVYYLVAGLNLIAAVITTFLPRSSAGINTGRSTFGDMLAGIRYIRRETIFLFIVIFAVCHVIGGVPFLQLLPVFTESILKISATRLGLLSSANYIGSVLSSLVLASLPDKKRGALLLLGGIIPGLAITVFAYSHWWYLSLVMVFIAGVGINTHQTMTATIVQMYAEPNYRARTQGLVSMATGLGGFGTFFAAILSEAVGLQLAVGGMSIFLFIVSVAFWFFIPRLRNLQ